MIYLGPKFLIIHFISLYDLQIFSFFQNFLKFKTRHNFLRVKGNQFYRTTELISSPIFQVLKLICRAQTPRHSLDFNAFYMIQLYFSEFFKICSN